MNRTYEFWCKVLGINTLPVTDPFEVTFSDNTITVQSLIPDSFDHTQMNKLLTVLRKNPYVSKNCQILIPASLDVPSYFIGWEVFKKFVVIDYPIPGDVINRTDNE